MLVLASNHFGGGTAVGIALAAGFLTLNTCATLIGGAFSAITMKGFTRHHDSAQVSPESRNNAITEVGYALAAALLVVFTAAVAVQTLGQADTEVSFKSFVASIDFVISGEMNNLITLNSDWVPFLRLVAHVVMIGVGFVFLSISLASAKNMWMKSED